MRSKIENCAYTKLVLYYCTTSYVSNEYFSKFIERYISTMPIDFQKKFSLFSFSTWIDVLLRHLVYAALGFMHAFAYIDEDEIDFYFWFVASLHYRAVRKIGHCESTTINVAEEQSISVLLWQMNGIGKVIVVNKYISIIDALSDYVWWFMLATSSKCLQEIMNIEITYANGFHYAILNTQNSMRKFNSASRIMTKKKRMTHKRIGNSM